MPHAYTEEPCPVSFEMMLRGKCEPSRLLDLVENLRLFSEHKAALVKIIAQNHPAGHGQQHSPP